MNPQPKPQRAPKKPRKPLRRSWIKRKPARRLKRAGANPGYVAWLHSLTCIGLAAFPGDHTCEDTQDWNPIEQSRERNMTGLGLKAPDLRSVPMCRSLHGQWEQRRGRFHDWTKDTRRVFMDKWIGATNAVWFALTPEGRAEWDAAAQRKER